MTPPAPAPRRTPGWLGAAVVAVVALAASLAGLRNGWVQDDVVLILQNARMHGLANWQVLVTSSFWPPPWSEDLYRPLTALLLAAQYDLGGGEPLVFRAVSYLLHAAASVAVLALAARLVPPLPALAAALLFAAHPVHVEAVALAVGQNELLVGLLAALMTAHYLHCRRAAGALRYRDWALLGAGYVAASLAKETGLVLPGLLLAAEVFLVPGPVRPRARQVAPGLTFLAGLGVLVIAVRTAVLSGDLVGSFTADALAGQSAGGRALTMLRVVPHWARLLLWPADLQADYSPEELVPSTGFGGAEALGLALVAGAVAATLLARRRAPVVAFGFAWLAVGLLPVSNVLVPTGILLAERTLFLPSIGVVLALAGSMAALPAGMLAARPARWLLAAAGTALVVAGVGHSAARHRVWRDERTFTVQGVADAPRSFRMQMAYGEMQFLDGRPADGIASYQRAIRYAPPHQGWRVRNDLARRFWEEGNAAAAVEQLEASLRLAPDQEESRNYLILGYLNLGRYADAAREADAALARGFSRDLFAGLRALADTAIQERAPAGSIRIRVVRPEVPGNLSSRGPLAPPPRR